MLSGPGEEGFEAGKPPDEASWASLDFYPSFLGANLAGSLPKLDLGLWICIFFWEHAARKCLPSEE